MRQKQIDNIMDYFEFGKVSKAMKALNWHWEGVEGGIPNESEIRVAARKRLNEVYDHFDNTGEEMIIASGGFEAEIKIEHDGSIGLHLRFVLEGWDNYNTDEYDD